MQSSYVHQPCARAERRGQHGATVGGELGEYLPFRKRWVQAAQCPVAVGAAWLGAGAHLEAVEAGADERAQVVGHVRGWRIWVETRGLSRVGLPRKVAAVLLAALLGHHHRARVRLQGGKASGQCIKMHAGHFPQCCAHRLGSLGIERSGHELDRVGRPVSDARDHCVTGIARLCQGKREQPRCSDKHGKPHEKCVNRK